MADHPIRVYSLTLDNINWTPFVMPSGANSLYWLNPLGNPAVKRRTDDADPLTETSVGDNQSEAFMVNALSGTHRFQKGTTIGYFKAVSGAPQIQIICVS